MGLGIWIVKFSDAFKAPFDCLIAWADFFSEARKGWTVKFREMTFLFSTIAALILAWAVWLDCSVYFCCVYQAAACPAPAEY